MKYRKKPVVIEAIKFERGSYLNCVEFTKGNITLISPSDNLMMAEIQTLEGPHIATEGDYIIKGVKGEFYPCKPDIFDMTYEVVE